MTEKIVQRFALGLDSGHFVRSGDYISVKPRHVMTHDNTAGAVATAAGGASENNIYLHWRTL